MVTSEIDPGLFSDAEEILRTEFSFGDFPDWVPFIILPKEIADHGFRYRRTPGPKHPLQFLQDNNGDCEDHTAFLGSLYTALGLETAVIHVEQATGEEAHILPVVAPSADISFEKACDLIKLYYYEMLNRRVGSIATFSADEIGETIVVGSTITDYVGDIQELIDANYAYRDSDRWHWHNKNYCRPVRKINKNNDARV